MKTNSKWVEIKKLEQDAFMASTRPLKISRNPCIFCPWPSKLVAQKVKFIE
jgi:hypothetical protein